MVVLAWLSIPGPVRVALLVTLGALLFFAATKPHVRKSLLVRAGFGVFLVGFIPLVVVGSFITDNPVGLGFLFAFLAPVSVLLVISGTVLALATGQPGRITLR
jgi:hypothetical protein